MAWAVERVMMRALFGGFGGTCLLDCLLLAGTVCMVWHGTLLMLAASTWRSSGSCSSAGS